MRALALLAAIACAAPARADDARAQERFRAGMAHYNLAEFDAAIADFKAAYELSQAPALLFNLAQAARLAHHDEQALHFYKTYLRLVPDAPNRDDAEAHIAELEAALRAPAQPVAWAPAPRAAASLRSSPPSGRALVIGGAATAAAGLGMLGAAIGLGVDSSHLADSLSSTAKKGGMWTPQQQATYDQGRREAVAADVLYAVGGAAAAAGAVVAIVGASRGVTRHLGVAPGPRGASVTGWFRF